MIAALNADMPFDQFTIKQLAGDMLPNASIEDRVATGFHRNTMLNEEGGIDPLEYRYYAVVDRVGTTGTVWLGLTVRCAQCHTHKFDPIPHRDYYRMMAFLNNADEKQLDIPVPALISRRQQIERQVAAAEADLPNQLQQRPPPGVAKDTRIRRRNSSAGSGPTSSRPPLDCFASGPCEGQSSAPLRPARRFSPRQRRHE